MKWFAALVLPLALLALVVACEEEEEEAATATPSPAATATATPQATPSPEPTLTPEATPVVTPTGPDLGALQQLADPDAKNLSMREFELNDETFAELTYDLEERVASPGFGSQGGVMDTDRQYLEVYRWADGSWERAFSLYEFLPAIYSPGELGPVVDNKPQAATATATARLTPVQFEAEIGDVLFLETSLMFGPEGLQHPAPTITALVWKNGEFHIAYSEEFAVRGGMIWVRAEGEYIELGMDAYLTTDPMCCPSGWEMLRLAPTELGNLWPEERCVGPEHSSCFE
jgi:pyruvate/2-oxoglutarate dehydrogenase complex dihydrolipoamide acyltransferase (E2) component